MFHRYVIRAADVVAIGRYQAASSRYVVLCFRIANSDVCLTLALTHNGMMQELIRQLSLNSTRPRLVPILEQTLQIRIDQTFSAAQIAGNLND